MSTIREVSILAGVSQATVSRVMNGSDRVTESTRQKVKAAMAQLSYKPNSAAQSLASSRSNTLGMVVSFLDGPFYGPVMSGVEETLRQRNKHLIIASGHARADQEMDAIEYLSNRQVDGLILLTECIDADYLKRLNQKIPIYLINQHVDGLEERNMYLDNAGGVYQATKHLIEQGHTKIVCAGGQMFKQDANERVEGYRKAMRDAGLHLSEDFIARTEFEFEGGITAMKIFEERRVDFTAVVAGSDEMAVAVIEWASSKGLTVPNDISVVGFDDMLMSNYVRPRLTTLHFPVYEMAKASAELAFEEIYNKRPPHGLEFKPSLVIRDSVMPPKK